MAHPSEAKSPHEAPESILPYDAPELYIPPHDAIYPSVTNLPHEGADSPQTLHPLSLHHPDSALSPVTPSSKDPEAAFASETPSWKARRICKLPLLIFLPLALLLLLSVLAGGIIGGLASSRKADTSTKLDTPPAILSPRNDTWYYLTALLLTPTHPLALSGSLNPSSTSSSPNSSLSTPPSSVTITPTPNTGADSMQWSFQPLTSDYSSRYRTLMNITSPIYLLYNRALSNITQEAEEK